MNALSIYARRFDFDVEPIFKIYNDVACYWSLPEQEHIITQYDFAVNRKIKDFQFVSEKFKLNAWNTELWDKETYKYVEQSIGMKIRLEQNELIDVFHTFHMLYVDNYGNFHNMPIKDVW